MASFESMVEKHVATAVATALGPRGLEVVLPELTISKEVLDSSGPRLALKRHTCTLPDDGCPFDLSDYEQWLTTTHGLKEAALNDNILALKRFFSSLEWQEDENVNPIGIICSLYKTGLFRKMMELPAFDRKYGWSIAIYHYYHYYYYYLWLLSIVITITNIIGRSRNIVTALDHLCEYLAIECGKPDPEWTKAKEKVLQFQAEVLPGYSRQSQANRKVADRAKKREDAGRLEEFPPICIQQRAVKQAMVDLQQLFQVVAMMASMADISPAIVSAATTAMICIIFYNGFAGRIGEWQAMIWFRV